MLFLSAILERVIGGWRKFIMGSFIILPATGYY
jgi:hypothetical protein